MSERVPAKYKSQRSYKVAENHLHLCLQPGLCIHACCPLPLSTSFFIISFVLPDTSYLCSEVLPTTECGGTSPLEPVTEQSLVLRVVLCYDQPMLGSCLLRQAFHCIKTKNHGPLKLSYTLLKSSALILPDLVSYPIGYLGDVMSIPPGRKQNLRERKKLLK